MIPLIGKLHGTGLLTGAGVLRLLESVLTTGVNLMAMLRVAAKLHPERTAVIDERGPLTYAQLWRQSEALAAALFARRGVRGGHKVALACGNHASAVKALFAAARLGAHVYLVNPESSPGQIRALEESLRFDLYVHDERAAAVFAGPPLAARSLPAYHPTGDSIDRMALGGGRPRPHLPRVKTGNLVVLTGGTTGRPKAASRKPSVLAFLPPFVALLTRLHLDRSRSVYVATPMYHGFGLAALLMGVILGAKMYLTERFDAGRACALVARNRIQAVTLVPLMLQRMLQADAGSLASLRRIISGGAWLNPALARETLGRLGPVLFNLYGTSEAGFCIMAGPDTLARKPESVGQPVWGVRAAIVDPAGREAAGGAVGCLRIKSAWATSRTSWIETGDLAYRDADGDIFLAGRADDMIVSGGENVYPIELENVLVQHLDVEAVAVVGIPDAEFGQRLKAVVVAKRAAALDPSALRDWLKPRVARYQMPAVIEVRDQLPHTPLGKIDKKALRAGGVGNAL
jgi:acyl-CoA synthetase (AMP-forming)/AMP-acid ligase II